MILKKGLGLLLRWLGLQRPSESCSKTKKAVWVVNVANFLSALSVTGFAFLGVIEASLSFEFLIVLATIFLLMGVIGRYLDD